MLKFSHGLICSYKVSCVWKKTFLLGPTYLIKVQEHYLYLCFEKKQLIGITGSSEGSGLSPSPVGCWCVKWSWDPPSSVIHLIWLSWKRDSQIVTIYSCFFFPNRICLLLSGIMQRYWNVWSVKYWKDLKEIVTDFPYLWKALVVNPRVILSSAPSSIRVYQTLNTSEWHELFILDVWAFSLTLLVSMETSYTNLCGFKDRLQLGAAFIWDAFLGSLCNNRKLEHLLH